MHGNSLLNKALVQFDFPSSLYASIRWQIFWNFVESEESEFHVMSKP